MTDTTKPHGYCEKCSTSDETVCHFAADTCPALAAIEPSQETSPAVWQRFVRVLKLMKEGDWVGAEETLRVALSEPCPEPETSTDVMKWARELCIRERTGDASIRALHSPEPCDDCGEYAEFLTTFAADAVRVERERADKVLRALVDLRECIRDLRGAYSGNDGGYPDMHGVRADLLALLSPTGDKP